MVILPKNKEIVGEMETLGMEQGQAQCGRDRQLAVKWSCWG